MNETFILVAFNSTIIAFESDQSVSLPFHHFIVKFPISERGEAADAHADGPIDGAAKLLAPSATGLPSRRLGHSRRGRGGRGSRDQPRSFQPR